MEHSEELDNAVAIIGMGCRFPRAGGVDEYWKQLLANTDAVGPIPADRFDITDYYAPAPATAGKTVSRHGGFLDDVFGFDAAFFGIPPVEARGMDPQQRILLQVVWEALEDAGVLPSSLAGTRGGVFVGQATTEYAETGPGSQAGVREMVGSRLRAATAGRVSYALDLRGPSVVLDTACSSSLVAVHAARQSLLTGESDLAVAGAVSVILSPADSIAYSQGGMLSAKGRCRFGDAHADGFVRSEGVAAVILKRLPDALRDGDSVTALVLGSAVTNDGKASGLLLHPSVAGQAQMLQEACRSANIDPARLDYVEAHGTGTPVGDAVELQALAQAAGHGREAGAPLRTGSVKTNIGHTEAAAGLAGLIKAALIARHGVIPASLHLEQPHPLLAENRIPVEVVRTNTPLNKAGRRALVGVSSFGLTGTNAHVVLAEHLPAAHRQPRPEPGVPPARLLVLSARSRASLLRQAASFASWLEPAGAGRNVPLHDVCATAALRRQAHPHRLWAVGTTHDDLATVLRALADGRSHPDGGISDAGTGTPRQTVFVLPGQGSQWLGMGRGLLASSPAFKEALQICDRAVRREAGWSVIDLLTRDVDALPDDVDLVQPALWAMQVALAAAWREKGVEPDVVIGHSMGEVAAARISDAMSPADAAAVICRRSRLMRRREGRGAMLVVELGPDRTRQVIAPYADTVCVAAENSPTTTVVAGSDTALTALEEQLRANDVLCRRVKVNVASHSPDMDSLRDDLGDLLNGLTPADTSCHMVSTVTGRLVAGPELTAAYWIDNLRRPVRFAETVRTVAERERSVFVEISPHPVLSAAVGETLAAHGLDGYAVASLRRGQDEHTELIRSAGRFFAAGGRIDFSRWYAAQTPPVALPPYHWDTTQYRQDTASQPVGPSGTRVLGASLGQLGAADWAGGVRVRGLTPVPPVLPLALMLEAGRQTAPGSAFALENVQLGDHPVDTESSLDSDLQITLAQPRADGTRPVRAEVVVPGTAERLLFAAGHLTPVQDEPGAHSAGTVDAALARCRRYLPAAAFEDLAARRGIEIGEPFRAVEQLWRGDGRAVARLRQPKAPLPAAWESGLLPLVAAWPAGEHTTPYVPTGFDRVRFLDEPGDEYWSVCSLQPLSARTARAHVLLLSPDGRELARFTGIRLHRLPGSPTEAGPGPSALTSRLTGLGWMLTSAVRGLPQAIRIPQRQTGRPRQPRPVIIPTPRPVAAQITASRPPRSGEELRTRAAALLGMAVADLDGRRPLRDFGLDSLMAAQLKQQLRTECGWEITAGRLLGDDSIETIERLLQEGQYT
ncbi:type I polyketide synthase [Streptomyces sp. NPDC002144]